MKQLKRKYFERLIAAVAVLFFLYSIVINTFFVEKYDSFYYLNLLVVSIILLIIMFLFYKLSKFDYDKVNIVKSSLLEQLKEKEEIIIELETELKQVKMCGETRLENQTKESELQKIVSEFLKNYITGYELLSYLYKTYCAMAAILYLQSEDEGYFNVEETIGLPDDFIPLPFTLGEGFNGQTAKDGKALIISDIPNDLFAVNSGLGKSKPRYLYLLPIMKNDNCVALIELATFQNNNIEMIWKNSAGNKNKIDDDQKLF